MGPDHTQHSPETETGYTGPAKKGASPDALEFANNSPMDSRNFVGIRAFVANKIVGKTDGRIGPEHVAALLTQAAVEARKTIDAIQLPPGHPADEWRLLKTDLLAAAALGEYYAARIRGTMHLEYAMKAGCEADYQLALKLLGESRAAWKTLAETTDTVYAPLNNPLRRQTKFQWGSLLKTLETMDAAIPEDCCICWDFTGLQENFDWPDFYCMMAPRWVMTQNGEHDECGTFFPAMARPVFEKEIVPCYKLFEKPERAVLRAHPGNHVFEVSTAIPFLDKALKPAPANGDK
jgi:hypothetical protein